MIEFAKYLDCDTTFYNINKKEMIISFLDTKIKIVTIPRYTRDYVEEKDNRIIENVNYQKCYFILSCNNKSHKIKVY
ncbi:MAG TPA: hypothetical protein VHJ38_14270 [Nitrososphaeraceae archaeon]|nr:hypothetical protein [Nitrososphaeraceae archaeon]